MILRLNHSEVNSFKSSSNLSAIDSNVSPPIGPTVCGSIFNFYSNDLFTAEFSGYHLHVERDMHSIKLFRRTLGPSDTVMVYEFGRSLDCFISTFLLFKRLVFAR